MLAIVRSAALMGVRGTPVQVEVHVSPGVPGFTIVGSPDSSCREARDRVRAALLSSKLQWPERRTTVNLAPSGVRKVGAGLDLAIAVGVLVATEQLPPSALDAAYVGELGLDGAVRGVPGVVPLAAALAPGELVVADESSAEAALVGGHTVRAARSLSEVVACVTGSEPWSAPRRVRDRVVAPPPDLAEVRGNRAGRFALEVAAAGGHHMLMVGPPGAGKTMLAERMAGILAPLDDAEAVEVTTVHSAAGEPLPSDALLRTPPYRAPHHTVSHVALVGGGSRSLKPGEISLAHCGVLFLDEMGEFGPVALDSLRQPLESGLVRISRAHAAATLPARFQLVASMNPCPCGFAGGGPLACRCSSAQLARYARRVSGPLLDRFDIRIRIDGVDGRELLDAAEGESSRSVASRVAAARERAARRGVRANRFLSAAQLATAARLDGRATALLEQALSAGRLSARGLRRVKVLALTLDDLRGGSGVLDAGVVAQAMALRADLRFGDPEAAT